MCHNYNFRMWNFHSRLCSICITVIPNIEYFFQIYIKDSVLMSEVTIISKI